MKKNLINREDGFLVQILFILFYYAERISIFYWFRKISNFIWIKKHKDEIINDKDGTICKKLKMPIGKSYILPEIWAIGNIIWTILWFNLIEKGIVHSNYIIWIILILSLLRVWELFIYQVNVLFFHRLNSNYIIPNNSNTDIDKAWKKFNELHSPNKPKEYAIKSATRTILLLIFNMIEYVFQFSLMYTAIGIISSGVTPVDNILASFEIFMNLSTFNEVIDGSNIYLVKISQAETILGIFMNILCLARFIGMLPEVAQIDEKK